jgi:hypothetical protein
VPCSVANFWFSLQRPAVRILVRRNLLVATVVHSCFVGMVGWPAILDVIKWLLSCMVVILLHACLRRPSWHLTALRASQNARTFGWIPPALYECFVRPAPLPPEGIESLLRDTATEFTRSVKSRWWLMRTWLCQGLVALRFELQDSAARRQALCSNREELARQSRQARRRGREGLARRKALLLVRQNSRLPSPLDHAFL